MTGSSLLFAPFVFLLLIAGSYADPVERLREKHGILFDEGRNPILMYKTISELHEAEKLFENLDNELKDEFESKNQQVKHVLEMLSHDHECTTENLASWASDRERNELLRYVNLRQLVESRELALFDSCREFFRQFLIKKKEAQPSAKFNEIRANLQDRFPSTTSFLQYDTGLRESMKEEITKYLSNLDLPELHSTLNEGWAAYKRVYYQSAIKAFKDFLENLERGDCEFLGIIRQFYFLTPRDRFFNLIDNQSKDKLERIAIYCSLNDYNLGEVLENIRLSPIEEIRAKIFGLELIDPEVTHQLIMTLIELSLNANQDTHARGREASHILLQYENPNCMRSEIARLTNNYNEFANPNLKSYYKKFLPQYLTTCVKRQEATMRIIGEQTAKTATLMSSLAWENNNQIKWVLRPVIPTRVMEAGIARFMLQVGVRTKKPSTSRSDVKRLEVKLNDILADVCNDSDAIEPRDREDMLELIGNMMMAGEEYPTGQLERRTQFWLVTTEVCKAMKGKQIDWVRVHQKMSSAGHISSEVTQPGGRDLASSSMRWMQRRTN